jgi:hypothetical protein
MNAAHFDAIVRSFRSDVTRRDVVLRLSAAIAGLTVARLGDAAIAKKKHKHKKKKKIKRNLFGCVDVGNFCQNSEQCCSGICQGKKCQAHDADVCQAGDDICRSIQVSCMTSSGDEGVCARTTGNASICETGGVCFPCKRDVDCQTQCGPASACIVCASQCAATGATACVGPSLESCGLP